MVRNYVPSQKGWTRAQWEQEHWGHILPLEERGPMPETKPDIDFLDHDSFCDCYRCATPEVEALKRRALRKAAGYRD